MWDERYQTEDYVFGTAPNEFLVRSQKYIPPGGSVLSVADGEGRNGVWLAEQGFKVTAVDSSLVGLAKAERLADSRGVALNFQEVDLLSWEWPSNLFDSVVAIFIQFAGPQDRRAMFKGMIKSLNPNGVLLLEGYRIKQLNYGTGGPPQIENLYTEEQLREELEPLQIEHIESYDVELSEGTGHSGMSALIDVIARKSS